MIALWILFGLFGAVSIAHVLFTLWAHTRELKRYGVEIGPLVLRNESPEDRDLVRRAAAIAALVDESGNDIAARIGEGIMWKGKRLTFVHCIQYRLGHPNETWEEYLERFIIEKAEYIDVFHDWLWSQSNLPWYEENVLKQNGADQAHKFINYN